MFQTQAPGDRRQHDPELEGRYQSGQPKCEDAGDVCGGDWIGDYVGEVRARAKVATSVAWGDSAISGVVIGLRSFLVLGLCIVLGTGAHAVQHPVPLKKDVNSAECIGCHGDKSKGKHVHSAIAMGCTTCHVVTSVKGATLVSLVSPADQLCFTCHEKSGDKVLHGPYAQGKCTVCHSPHASAWPNQLRAPTQDLCMGCHVRARLKINAQKRIATLPWGAKVTFDQLQGAQSLGLNKALTANHPVEGHPVTGPNTELGKGAAAITCLSCHQAHHSKQANLLPANLSSATALCESCHRNPIPNPTQ